MSPYIKQIDRPLYDDKIDGIVEELLTFTSTARAGQLTYVLYRLVKGAFPPIGYSNIVNARGCLFNTADEYYRRDATSYEDGKIIENGDV
jgi:hypothetical protein